MSRPSQPAPPSPQPAPPSPQHSPTLIIGRLWDGQPALPSEAILLRLVPEGDGLLLEVDAPDHGDPPPDAPPGSVDGLWEYEVVELFIASVDAPTRYLEVELGPHGHHLVLQLDGVRSVTASGLPLPFTVSVKGRRGDGRWRGQAHLSAALLPPPPWQLNATAIHGQGAERRYLSWQPLPGEAPDFHQPERFVSPPR